jgi:hypothetical protein
VLVGVHVGRGVRVAEAVAVGGRGVRVGVSVAVGRGVRVAVAVRVGRIGVNVGDGVAKTTKNCREASQRSPMKICTS